VIKINAVGKKKKRKERGNVEFCLHLKKTNKQTKNQTRFISKKFLEKFFMSP